MKYEKTRLKPGVKVGHIGAFDNKIAQIASILFEKDVNLDSNNLYRLELIKTKKNCKTYRLSLGNDVYYLKKFFEQSLFKKICNFFRSTKAFRCYSVSFKLSAANIPVAEPIMYLINTKRIIEKESIFVTKKVDGISLRDFLKQDIHSILKEKVLKKLFYLLGHFYKNGFIHGDPGLYNYFIDLKNDDYLITFLDLDVIHKLPRMPVIVALNGLAKIYSLSGSYFVEKWPILVKTFLEAFNKQIKFDKSMRYLKNESEKRIARLRKRNKARKNIHDLSLKIH